MHGDNLKLMNVFTIKYEPQFLPMKFFSLAIITEVLYVTIN